MKPSSFLKPLLAASLGLGCANPPLPSSAPSSPVQSIKAPVVMPSAKKPPEAMLEIPRDREKITKALLTMLDARRTGVQADGTEVACDEGTTLKQSRENSLHRVFRQLSVRFPQRLFFYMMLHADYVSPGQFMTCTRLKILQFLSPPSKNAPATPEIKT